MRTVAAFVVSALAATAVIAPASSAQNRSGQAPAAPTTTVVAVGDIACQPGTPGYNSGNGRGKVCRQKSTAALATSLDPDAVLMLGDLQYEDGYRRDYALAFDRTWGQPFLNRSNPSANRMWPVPGNHDYRDPHAVGYFSYFNGGTPAKPAPTGIAGTTHKGWYRYDGVPGWTLLALNADCTYLKGGCDQDSAQYAWLKAQLQNTQKCTLAYWHQPLFNKGKESAAHGTRDWWRLLHKAGADLVLNGHDHTYQRFPRLNPAGKPDPSGIQQITIGTGGVDLTGFAKKPSQPSVVTKSNTTIGVLQLELGAGSYTWKFQRADFPGNGRYSDSGTSACV